MTELLENVELADKNTFRLPAKARYYAEFSTVEELKDLLGRPEVAGLPVFILGGGSNLVLTKDYEGLMLHSVDRSVRIVREDEAWVDVTVGAGKDWSEFVDAISVAFQEEVQMDMFTSFIEADNKLPTQDKFVITDELTKENKSKFDELIEDVEAANAGADVVILGLKSDLQKLERLQDVDWIADSQKEERARLGRLGSYGVTTLVEIPQRFAKNDVTKKLIKPGKLYIMPNVDNKFVKFTDVGETEIIEVSEKGERQDDFQTYEVQREMGIAVILDKYHGVFNIAN